MARNNLRKAGILGVRLSGCARRRSIRSTRCSRCASLSLDLEDGAREALISALFRATWSDGVHVSDPAVVARVADGVGLPGAALVERAGAPEIKQRLRAQTDAAIARDVFGVPTFEVEGELFWGYDDIPYLERFLAGEDTIDPEDAAHWVPRPPRPSSMRRRFREQAPLSWQRDLEGKGD
jgi:2-hydroxychromene-2-carboxylate isomerase